MINKVALTANGNKYEKSNIGKKAGLAAGVSLGAIAGATDFLGEGALKVAKGGIGGAAYLGAIALGVGALVDHFIINKNRMTQADGEAKLNANA